jgi:hypothetical protein
MPDRSNEDRIHTSGKCLRIRSHRSFYLAQGIRQTPLVPAAIEYTPKANLRQAASFALLEAFPRSARKAHPSLGWLHLTTLPLLPINIWLDCLELGMRRQW